MFSLTGLIIMERFHVRKKLRPGFRCIKELMETLKPQDLDWSFIAENVDAWVEKAELEYVQ